MKAKRRGTDGWAAAAWLLAVVGACVAALNVYKMLYSLSVPYHDYAFIRAMIVHTAQGRPIPFINEDTGASVLAQHWVPLFWPLAWLYRVLAWDHLYAWLLGGAWYLAVLVAGLFARRVTGRTDLGIAVGAMLFISLYSRRLFFSPHWEVFQVPCFIGAALCYRVGRPWAFAGLAALAAMAREDVPLYVAGLAAGLALDGGSRRMRLVAVSVASVALAYFAVVDRFLIPLYQPAGDAMGLHAGMLDHRWGRGSSLGAIARNLLTHPGDILAALTGRAVIRLLEGFAFLPLLRPAFFAVACVPPMLIMALSRQPDYAQFAYYHSAGMLGPLAVGTALALPVFLRLGSRWRSPWPRAVLAAAATVALVAGNRSRHEQVPLTMGLTPGAEPRAVTLRTREVIRRIRAYPYDGRVVSAGFFTFPHVPCASNPRWITRWRSERPAVILLDERRDAVETAWVLGERRGIGAVTRALAAEGYRRQELYDGLVAWVRE